MSRTLAILVFGLVALAAMEPWARVLHGSVWHGALYSIHRSHHTKRVGRFERNDALSGLHAPIAIALVMTGCNVSGWLGGALIGSGAGMTVFGLAYVLVHDGLVHRRLPLGRMGTWLVQRPYVRRVRDAHRIHHATGEAPFGLFLGPYELTKAPRARAARPTEARREDRALAARPNRRQVDGVRCEARNR